APADELPDPVAVRPSRQWPAARLQQHAHVHGHGGQVQRGIDESVIEVERTHTQHAMTVPWTCYARWHEAPAGDRRGPRSRLTAATCGRLRLCARGGRSAVPRGREGDGGPLLPGGAAGARAIRDPISDRRAASARAAAAGPGPV